MKASKQNLLEPSLRAEEIDQLAPVKFLPVVFVWLTIAYIATVYIVYSCIPLLQTDETDDDEGAFARGVFQLTVFSVLTFFLAVSYLQSIFTNPGRIPSSDPQWEYVSAEGAANDNSLIKLQELKASTGARRHCKWCQKYKPDRCHHCRICKACILKMDHHCPWIYNCVGFHNYKYFILVLFYSALDCYFIFISDLDTVYASVQQDDPFWKMFNITFAETLAGFCGLAVSCLLTFHIWLLSKALTTIEFCEKSVPGKAYNSIYDFGIYENAKAAFGDNPLLWLLPVPGPSGNGLSFESDEDGAVFQADMGASAEYEPIQSPSGRPPQKGLSEVITV